MISPEIDCPKCFGSGFVNGGRTCPCVQIQELRIRVQQSFAKYGKLFERVEIPKYVAAKASPLVSEGRAKAENMVIRAEWPQLMHHLACCVVVESLRDRTVFSNEWPLLATNDLAIRSMYFADGKAMRHTDLVQDQALVVIRLGQASPHGTNAPALYEVMSMADDASIPTWLVETPSKPFKGGHASWSADTAERIKDWPRINLVPAEDDPRFVDLAAAGKAGA